MPRFRTGGARNPQTGAGSGAGGSEAERLEIDTQVRRAAYQIIAGKRATCYGIGSAVARLVDVLLHDQRAILTVCSHTAEVGDVRTSRSHCPAWSAAAECWKRCRDIG